MKMGLMCLVGTLFFGQQGFANFSTLELKGSDNMFTVPCYAHASAFYELPISESEKQGITKLVKSMGTLSLYKLLWKKSELEKIGKRIDNVHPLRFLGHIFSNPRLKGYMPEITKSSFKWKNFMKGLANRLTREHSSGNVEPFILGFSEYIGADQSRIKAYAANYDWEGLVHYLIAL